MSSRLHFYVRLLGLTGLWALVLGTGTVLIAGTFANAGDVPTKLLDNVSGKAQVTTAESVALWAMLIGGVITLLLLLLWLLSIVRSTAGRRSAFGLNVAAQIALALALVVGVNWYAFQNYQQIDCTHDRRFTLPEDLVQQLRRLRSETTIVVLQQKSREGLSTSQQYEDYESAAGAVVVEKVYDLVDRLRELGPRFKVVVLNAAKKTFRSTLEQLKKEKPKLAQAILNSPESSIFFYSQPSKGNSGEGDDNANIQRLAFRDFYQLDRVSSLKADKGKGNLVLLSKGVRPFIRRILNVEERKPVVGVLVSHQLLTTAGREGAFSQKGFRDVLERHGFEVRDVILKDWDNPGGGEPKPAADTVQDLQYRSLIRERDRLSTLLSNFKKDRKAIADLVNLWSTATLEKLTEKYKDQLGGGKVTERIRQINLSSLQRQLAIRNQGLREIPEEIKKADEELAKMPVEKLKERQHMVDPVAKLRQAVSECDLLFMPRLTIRSLSSQPIPEFVHTLREEQVEVIKNALKKKKPLLVALGPTSTPPFSRAPAAVNHLEKMLTDLGIRLNKDTVLFEESVKEKSDEQVSEFLVLRRSDPPGLNFKDSPLDLYKRPGVKEPMPTRAHPLFESLQSTSNLLGEELKLRFAYPRPVFYAPSVEQQAIRYRGVITSAIAYAPHNGLSLISGLQLSQQQIVGGEFLLTNPKSWADANPFRRDPQRPDPEKINVGGLDRSIQELKFGPVPVAVAVDTLLPGSWYQQGDKLTHARVAVLGSADVFNEELSPAAGRLLLDTCNWLLEREDLLNRKTTEWSYPRVDVGEKGRAYWGWAACLGLPLIFAYLGLVTGMRRRVR